MSVEQRHCINVTAEQLQISRQEAIIEKLTVALDRITQSQILAADIHRRDQYLPSVNFREQAEKLLSKINNQLQMIEKHLSEQPSRAQQTLPYPPHHSEKPTIPDITPERRASLRPQNSDENTSS